MMEQESVRFVVVSSQEWGRTTYELLPDELRLRTVFLGSSNDFTFETLERIMPKFVFVLHWSTWIPKGIYDSFNCVIFHMTDLPYGRGGSPLQNLILRGHEETMVSAVKCVDELDAGPVYLKSPLSLEGSAREIFDRLVPITAKMIAQIVATNPVPEPQQGRPVKFKRQKPENGSLENAQSLREAYDIIRMLDAEGYPNAFLETGKLRLDFTDAAFDGEYLTAKVVLEVRKRR